MMVKLPTHICVTRPQWVNKTRLVLVWWPGFYDIKVNWCKQKQTSFWPISLFNFVMSSWKWKDVSLWLSSILVNFPELRMNHHKPTTRSGRIPRSKHARVIGHAIWGKHEPGSWAMQMQKLQIQGVIHGIYKTPTGNRILPSTFAYFGVEFRLVSSRPRDAKKCKVIKWGQYFLCFNGKYEEKT